MPILLFVLLVILVATFGFWDTLEAECAGPFPCAATPSTRRRPQ
jgi:hypothetical protein